MSTLLDEAVVVEGLIFEIDGLARIRHELLQRQVFVAALDAVDALPMVSNSDPLRGGLGVLLSGIET